MKSLEYQNAVYDYKTWQVMQEYMPKQMVSDFSRRFRTFDPKDRGVVKTEDVVSILESLGRNVSPQQIRIILKDLTGNVDMSAEMEYIDFKEYMSVLSVLMTECIPEDEMYLVFRQFDLDGDGFITSEELRQLLQRLGDEISDNDLKDMMKEADLDGDGRVSYSEFIRVMTNSDEATNSEIDFPSSVTVEVSASENHPMCQITEQILSDSDCDDENTEHQTVAEETLPSKTEISTEVKPKIQRMRSFSLGSQMTLMPINQQRSPVPHRRKMSLSEMFHFPAAGRRRNSRQSCPSVLEPKESHKSEENICQQKESKRRFSAGAAHLRHLFKRKQKTS